MYQVEYAALKYYNSAISEECLYVGMLFNNLTTGQRDFQYISKISRFASFDDEADVDFVKMYLNGIKQQVENNIFNYQSFDIKSFTKFFVNEFRFTKVMTLDVEEEEDYVTNLSKMYMKYDFSKENRLSKTTEKQMIKRILSSKYVEFSAPEISGDYNENIIFDYVIKNMAIKFFSFKNKNLKKIIPMAKQWSFTAEEIKNRMEVIFIYDTIEEDSDCLKTILDILRKNAAVFHIQEGLEYIMNKYDN